MSNMRLLGGLFCLIALFGCAIVVESPVAMLNEAEKLSKQGQPVTAEKIIWDAIGICKKRGDEHCLGDAYRAYADLLRSGSLEKRAMYFRENGFKDHSVTYENRDAKALEYYSKAIDSYKIAEGPLQDKNRFEVLSTMYFDMAYSYRWSGDIGKSCNTYDRALAAFDEYNRRNPDNAIINPFSTARKTAAEEVAEQKNSIGCWPDH